MHEISDKINALGRNDYLTIKDFNFWNDNLDKIKSELEDEYNHWKDEKELDVTFIEKRI